MDYKARERIISGLLRRDEAVIRWLYVRVYGYLEMYILRRGGTVWDVMDIYQEGLLTLYELAKNPSVLPDTTLPAYLFGICRYLWFKQLRRRCLMIRVPDFPGKFFPAYRHSDFPLLSDRRELRYILYLRHMEFLDPSCRRLLALYRSGMRVDDIVREMDLSSRNYAYRKKFECMRRLVEAIRSDPEHAYIR